VEIDAKDSTTLKGMAILAVVLHNYFHLLSPVKEDEFSFDPARFHALLAAIRQPTEAVPALFSYFGHYGVQIFIFISAYGLAVKYWDDEKSGVAFFWQRIKKIYPMFVSAMLCWPLFLILRAGPNGAVEFFRECIGSLWLTILGIQNIVPHDSLPPVGPWWFLPFILQFYALWPGLRRCIIRTGTVGMVILSSASLLMTYCCNDFLSARWHINLLQTPIGHLPEFCLGIAAARYGFLPSRRVVLAAVGVFALSNLDAHFWLLSFSSSLVLMLAVYPRIRGIVRQSPKLSMLGTLSLPLFLVNGFVRRPFVNLVFLNHSWLLELAFAVTTTVTAVWVAAYLYRIEGVRTGTGPGILSSLRGFRGRLAPRMAML